jgi:hypothetical protein
MWIRNISVVVTITWLLTLPVLAVGEAAVPFLTISPGTKMNGMGKAGVALRMDNPYAAFYNPAHLGHFGSESQFAFQNNHTDWSPNSGNGLKLESTIISFGLPMSELGWDVPLSIGLSYHDLYFDLGINEHRSPTGQILGTFSSNESYEAYSIGLNYGAFANIAIGMTYKAWESNLAPEDLQVGNTTTNGRADGSAFDFGFHFEYPLFDYQDEDFTFELNEHHINNQMLAGMGVTYSNYGDRVTYDKVNDEPLPFAFTTGLSLLLSGKTTLFNDFTTDLEIYRLSLTTEVSEELIEEEGTHEYIYFPKKIQPFKGNSAVESRHGMELGLMELFYYRRGSFHGNGFPTIFTYGYTVSSSGIVKIFGYLSENDFIAKAGNYFVLQYNYSEFLPKEDQHPLDNTEFSSWTFRLKNIPLSALF